MTMTRLEINFVGSMFGKCACRSRQFRRGLDFDFIVAGILLREIAAGMELQLDGMVAIMLGF